MIPLANAMNEGESRVGADVAGLVAAIERAAADLAIAEEPAGFVVSLEGAFDEATALRLGHAYQGATAWHVEPPRL